MPKVNADKPFRLPARKISLDPRAQVRSIARDEDARMVEISEIDPFRKALRSWIVTP